ncbi:hypothetical protein EVAR_49_1 [Eumeta japonica]|uniref:Uncharacterized protein n=1 Tax=Eumeta variegata TaxID=151549 RepID=A0A4C1S7W9_EUMVA|nr:hypothetical protein EVAR_49_1 [Eumeta japonica]
MSRAVPYTHTPASRGPGAPRRVRPLYRRVRSDRRRLGVTKRRSESHIEFHGLILVIVSKYHLNFANAFYNSTVDVDDLIERGIGEHVRPAAAARAHLPPPAPQAPRRAPWATAPAAQTRRPCAV